MLFFEHVYPATFFDLQISKIFWLKAGKRVENGESRVGVSEVFERIEDLTNFR